MSCAAKPRCYGGSRRASIFRYDLRALVTRCEELAEDPMRKEAEQRESENALP